MQLPDSNALLTAFTVPFVGAVAWVGRLHQRVSRSEADIAKFTNGLEKHMADDAAAHQRIANIEGQLGVVVKSLERIEGHLLERK